MNKTEQISIFAETHKEIHDTSDYLLKCLDSSSTCELAYPPGIELDEHERELLSKINIPEESREVFKKILRDNLSIPVFKMMSLLDGVTDPYVIELEEWYGGSLGGEEDSMLHDDFFETYWDYDKNKKQS